MKGIEGASRRVLSWLWWNQGRGRIVGLKGSSSSWLFVVVVKLRMVGGNVIWKGAARGSRGGYGGGGVSWGAGREGFAIQFSLCTHPPQRQFLKLLFELIWQGLQANENVFRLYGGGIEYPLKSWGGVGGLGN